MCDPVGNLTACGRRTKTAICESMQQQKVYLLQGLLQAHISACAAHIAVSPPVKCMLPSSAEYAVSDGAAAAGAAAMPVVSEDDGENAAAVHSPPVPVGVPINMRGR